jgi:hypothetical protein
VGASLPILDQRAAQDGIAPQMWTCGSTNDTCRSMQCSMLLCRNENRWSCAIKQAPR